MTMIATQRALAARDQRDRLNSFDVIAYLEERMQNLLRVGVPDAAAFLDEHIPGWHRRITRPLDMKSVTECVLGQVFDPETYYEEGPRRLFGLLPPKRMRSHYSTGFMAGVIFLRKWGYSEQPFVFSSPKAAPFWATEITRRSR